MDHIHLRGKWRARTPRWYNAALTHTKWMGNLSSPTLNSNCENRRACFCQTSPGMHVWGVIVPIRTVLCAQIDHGYRTKAKPSLVFPTAMDVKVKDAKTTRKQIKCGSKTSRVLSPFLTSCKPFFAHARSQRMGFDGYGIRDRFLWAKMSNGKKSIMVCPPPQVQKESDLEKEARFLANPFSSFPIFYLSKPNEPQ